MLRRTKPPRTGAKPCFPRQRDAAPAKAGAHAIWRPHMKTLLGYTQALRPEPIRLGHMTNSLFTLQTTPPPGSAPDGVSYLLQTPDGARIGGGERIRTDDLLLAKQALSQLSYTPVPENSNQWSVMRNSDHCLLMPDHWMVGQGGFEPPTSRLSSARSNQLSY